MTLTEGSNLIVASIGEMVLSSNPESHLIVYGLGSCVALAAWDPSTQVGGLAHFMLPNGSANGASPVKFIDTGFERFLEALEARGAVPSRSLLKAAGAAAMLTVGGGISIGKRNEEMMLATLAEHGFQLTASALGGSVGRTVQLDVADGRFLIRSLSSVTEL